MIFLQTKEERLIMDMKAKEDAITGVTQTKSKTEVLKKNVFAFSSEMFNFIFDDTKNTETLQKFLKDNYGIKSFEGEHILKEDSGEVDVLRCKIKDNFFTSIFSELKGIIPMIEVDNAYALSVSFPILTRKDDKEKGGKRKRIEYHNGYGTPFVTSRGIPKARSERVKGKIQKGRKLYSLIKKDTEKDYKHFSVSGSERIIKGIEITEDGKILEKDYFSGVGISEIHYDKPEDIADLFNSTMDKDFGTYIKNGGYSRKRQEIIIVRIGKVGYLQLTSYFSEHVRYHLCQGVLTENNEKIIKILNKYAKLILLEYVNAVMAVKKNEEIPSKE